MTLARDLEHLGLLDQGREHPELGRPHLRVGCAQIRSADVGGEQVRAFQPRLEVVEPAVDEARRSGHAWTRKW
jgi:hypothetical protein